MKRSLMTNEEWRLSKAEKLASKFGIKVVGTEFAVCCPGIDDPFEKMGIKLSWASAEPDTIEVNLFIEFMKALIAVDYAVLFVEVSADHQNVDNIHHGMFKDLYTNLSVYGRAMFFDIVKQMFCPRKPIIFLALAHYPDEGLDFSNLYHDQGKTTVGDIYKAYVAPTVDPWVSGPLHPTKVIEELYHTKTDSIEMITNEAHELQTSDQRFESTQLVDEIVISTAGNTGLHAD